MRGKRGVPYAPTAPVGDNRARARSPITTSNLSRQTPAAASQNVPAGTGTRNSLIGRGETRVRNGEMGKGF